MAPFPPPSPLGHVTLPDRPGVYAFFENENILYIGKAKSLKKRYQSGYQNLNLNQNSTPRDHATHSMLSKATGYSYILTSTEKEALTLEAKLIKENRPIYNIKLKYSNPQQPLWLLNKTPQHPALLNLASRKIFSDNTTSLATGYSVPGHNPKKVIETLTSVTKIASCTPYVFKKAKKTKTPCLLLSLGRCTAPCIAKNMDENDQAAKETRNILNGKTAKHITAVEKKMKACSNDLEFEKAQVFKEQLEVLKSIKAPASDPRYNRTLICVLESAKILGFCKMVYLNGNLTEFLSGVEETGIYSSTELLKVLSPAGEEKVVFIKDENYASFPSEDQQYVKAAYLNCMWVLNRFVTDYVSKENFPSLATASLKKYLNLDKAPLTIESWDISHFGSNPVAACAVLKNTLPYPAGEKVFKIPEDLAGNDPGSLAFLARKRSKDSPPDLLLVDGAQAQLNAVQANLSPQWQQIPILGLAKRLETVHYNQEELYLPRLDPALLLLQRSRDRAHDKSISFQRKRRKVDQSALDAIPGLGKTRKTALLKAFKTPNSILESSIEELCSVPGVGIKLATEIKKFYKNHQNLD